MKAFIPSALSRTLYAVPMGVFGLFHFMNGPQMVGMVPDYFPAKLFLVYLVGAALLAASAAIIMNKKARLACYLLGAMLGIFVFTIYVPMVLSGDNEAAMGMLLKEIALAGAAFFIGNHMED